jgi:hypothetical protein
LAIFRGPITLTKAWAQSLLSRMGFVKQRWTTKAKVSVENFEIFKKSYLDDIHVASTVYKEEIPALTCVSWDQTGLNVIPFFILDNGEQGFSLRWSQWQEAVYCCFLWQPDRSIFATTNYILYQEKPQRCHPVFKFPLNWNVTHSPNHWSNEVHVRTTIQYLKEITILYMYVQQN